MTTTTTRLRIILTSTVTWLVTIAAAVPLIIAELEAAGLTGTIIRWGGTAATIASVAISIIRRVTPVLPAARGIIDTGAIATPREAALVDQLERIRNETP